MTDAEKLKRLRDAADSGVVRVDYDDHSVTFRSIDEIEKRIRQIEERISGRKPGNRRRLASFSKGLE